MSYDSREDTIKHQINVQERMDDIGRLLRTRSAMHDVSKLVSPEKAVFDEMTPLLKDCTYGSDEYKGFLERMKPALDHHYKHNRHHPEHHKNGIAAMSLIDLIEMLCDWKAAGERHTDGSIFKSLMHNRNRFEIEQDLFRTLCVTAKELNWITTEECNDLIYLAIVGNV